MLEVAPGIWKSSLWPRRQEETSNIVIFSNYNLVVNKKKTREAAIDSNIYNIKPLSKPHLAKSKKTFNIKKLRLT